MTLTQKTKSATSILAITAAALATMAMPITASAQIDEIVTTAQRTDQSLQDAPVAVTVISEELIENVQITDSLDVQRLVPTLNIRMPRGYSCAVLVKTKAAVPWSQPWEPMLTGFIMAGSWGRCLTWSIWSRWRFCADHKGRFMAEIPMAAP